MNVGGTVIVMPVESWFELADKHIKEKLAPLPPPQARTPDWERFKHDLENTLNDVACGHYSPEEGVELIVSDLQPFLSDVRHK